MIACDGHKWNGGLFLPNVCSDCFPPLVSHGVQLGIQLDC